MKLQNIPRNASKNYAIRKAFSDSNFDPVPILDTHDMSKRLGTTEGFEIDGKKYALAPWYIKHKDGTYEILEISLVPIKAKPINLNIAWLDEASKMWGASIEAFAKWLEKLAKWVWKK